MNNYTGVYTSTPFEQSESRICLHCGIWHIYFYFSLYRLQCQNKLNPLQFFNSQDNDFMQVIENVVNRTELLIKRSV